jgi:hypothetical protein
MSIDSNVSRHLEPPEPWRSFLRALDSQLKGAVTLRCLGGFVVTQQYGIGRSTGDIDFLSISTMCAEDNVERVGGLGSSLYKKYRVYVQYVGIATPPCDYADRLREMYPNSPWIARDQLSCVFRHARADLIPHELAHPIPEMALTISQREIHQRGGSQPNLVRKASVRRLVSDAQNSVFVKTEGSSSPSQTSVNPCGAPG